MNAPRPTSNQPRHRDQKPDAQLLDTLVLQAQIGDREAFRRLVLATQSELRVNIAWRVPTQDMVDEILQETFVTALQRLATYRPEGTFLPWLKGIARILILKELRRHRREVELHGDLLDQTLAAGDTVTDDDAQDEAEAVAALRDCLTRLTPRARLLLERRYGQGLPLAALARQFKQKANTLGVALMRIRSSLRDCMARGVTP